MTYLGISTYTDRHANGKWRQSISVNEGDSNYESLYLEYLDMDGTLVQRKLMDLFQVAYPQLGGFLFAKTEACLRNDRRAFLETNENVISTVDELEVGPELLRQHMSCWKKYKAEDGCRDAKNALEQSKGEVVFFTANNCPVCQSSYEE